MNPHVHIPAKSEVREPVVLIIDDDPNNLGIVTGYLEECKFTILVAEDGESGVARALYARPDLVLLDVMMPGSDGYETCRRLKAQESTRDIPVIFMTALTETEHKVRGFEAGAVDYITKPFHREEVLARVGVHLRIRELTARLQEAKSSLEKRVEERTAELEQANRELQAEISERKQAEDALKKSERKFRAIFDQTFQFIGLMSTEGTLLEANRPSLEFCGVNESDVVDKPYWETPWWSHSPELQEKLRMAVKAAATGEFVRFEATHLAPDENLHYFDFSLKPVMDETESVVLLIPEGRDITAHKKLEEQLRQAQKMEAVGTLAGGVAHDFNNILTAIIGFGSLLRMKMGEDDPLKHYIIDILSASERAANLTNSLLAFSRKQVMSPKAENLNEIVKRIDKLLLRVIGEDIEFKTILADEDLSIMADSGQIEQVIMNLATNSRDAMPDGGMLTIKTERVDVLDEMLGPCIKPGRYALISVSDTGQGIDKVTQQRIFEPFFTTKELGKGTGLGLSIVYGIVKQHQGEINVYSEPGRGTTFRIYLRLLESKAEKMAVPLPAPLVGGTETILLAEDDTDARRFICHMLEEYGYTVIEAVDGADAIRKFIAHKDAIRILVLDVVMPKMNGKEVYEEVRKISGDVRVLFTSGYTAEIIHKKGVLDSGVNFISKPVTPHLFLAKIRKALS